MISRTEMPAIEKEDTALEGRGKENPEICVLGRPGPCEHGALGNEKASCDVAGSEAEKSASSIDIDRKEDQYTLLL